MGRLCRAAKRKIDDLLEGGADAVEAAKRAARAARTAARRKLDETTRAIDELPLAGEGTEIQEQTRKALEELKKQYEDDLRKAAEELTRLENISSAYHKGTRGIDETFAMLDGRDAEFKGLSFEEASTRILAMLDAPVDRPQDPEVDGGPCPPFASPVDLDLARHARPVVDLDALGRLLSDAGLDRWARSIGATPPSELEPALRLPARVFYGAVAPGLSKFELAKDLAGGSAFAAPLVRELFADAIEQTRRVPAVVLERERAFQLAEPVRLAEFAQFNVLGKTCFDVGGDDAMAWRRGPPGAEGVKEIGAGQALRPLRCAALPGRPGRPTRAGADGRRDCLRLVRDLQGVARGRCGP
jgi:hypothetical protein